MREIIIDGLVGAMAAAFREGAELKALTESARLKNRKKMKSQGEKCKDGQQRRCVGALCPGPGSEVGALPIFPLVHSFSVLQMNETSYRSIFILCHHTVFFTQGNRGEILTVLKSACILLLVSVGSSSCQPCLFPIFSNCC